MKPKHILVTAALTGAGAMLMLMAACNGESIKFPDPIPTPIPTPSPNYTPKPSDTDGGKQCGEEGAIGCEEDWGDLANDSEHYLYLPTSPGKNGKLLLFLCGGHGSASTCENVYPVAAGQGYHVIGLTYPTGLDGCGGNYSCFGNFIRENVDGGPWSDQSNLHEKHPQDSIVNRLIKVLQWANANHGSDGWDYLTAAGEVDWTKVNLAGFSNGGTHVSLMGTMYASVARVALFAGPNDGRMLSDGWKAASYIKKVEGITDTRYYGLVHRLNNSKTDTEYEFKVANNWQIFGMEGPLNPPRKEFDPEPNVKPNFEGAHMLISTNPTTDHVEAHLSVVKDYECKVEVYDDEEKKDVCQTWEYEEPLYENEVLVTPKRLGYEAAWRCILGTGDASVSKPPVAEAGPDQTVQCQQSGGQVGLDGSASKDADCDVLTYTWFGPWGTVTGPKPMATLPVGTSTVTLVVSDPWGQSAQDTMQVTVDCPQSAAPWWPWQYDRHIHQTAFPALDLSFR